MKYFSRFFLTLAGGVGVLLAIYAFWSAWASAQLNQRLNALRAADMPVHLSDLQKEVPPPEENGAVWLRRAALGLEGIEKEIGQKIDLSETPGPETVLKMSEILTAHRGALEAVHRAADCPHYHSEPDYGQNTATIIDEQLKRVQLVRSAARALLYEAIVQQQTGKVDEALISAGRMLHLARHLTEEPTLIAYLTRVAITGMALARFHDLLSAELPPAGHEQIEAALAELDMQQVFRTAIEGERAFAIQSIDFLQSMDRTLPLSPLTKMHTSSLIDYLNLAHEAADMNVREAKQKLEFTTSMATKTWSPFVQLTAPAVVAALQANARVTASVRALRILNAAQAQGVADIAEVKIEDALWVDPFDGQRLRTAERDGLWTVYSVGRNLRDDQGVIDQTKDADVGWSLMLKADEGP